jgi:DNA mismatch repair protein MutL
MPAPSGGPPLNVPPLPAGLPPLPGLLPGTPPDPVEPAEQEIGFFSSLTYLGQLDRTYLVCEAAGELVLVDQHAAHERVAFQRLREAQARRAVPSQRLLLPLEVQFDEHGRAAAVENRALLASLGFELAPGDDRIALAGVPESLGRANPAEVFAEVVSELADGEATQAVRERLDHILATVACHSVVRAGDTLSAEEVRALFLSMDGVDYRAHCPHGRPVLLRISLGELERRFGRT